MSEKIKKTTHRKRLGKNHLSGLMTLPVLESLAQYLTFEELLDLCQGLSDADKMQTCQYPIIWLEWLERDQKKPRYKSRMKRGEYRLNLSGARELLTKSIQLKNQGAIKALLTTFKENLYHAVSTAAEQADTDMLKYLVERSSLKITKKMLDMGLRAAVKTGRLANIKYLVNEGASIELFDEETIPHYAIKSGSLPLVKYLVQKVGLDPFFVDEQRLLRMRASLGNTREHNIITFLLKQMILREEKSRREWSSRRTNPKSKKSGKRRCGSDNKCSKKELDTAVQAILEQWAEEEQTGEYVLFPEYPYDDDDGYWDYYG